jgi:hypothetical protein
MFEMKKFLQTVGISVFITIIFSVLIGFIQIPSYGWYIALQMLITYGSLGYFAARWNPKTPYTAAFLGATTISIMSLCISYFMFNILVFWDPAGIGRSISLAVLLTLLVTSITVFIQQKRAGATA